MSVTAGDVVVLVGLLSAFMLVMAAGFYLEGFVGAWLSQRRRGRVGKPDPGGHTRILHDLQAQQCVPCGGECWRIHPTTIDATVLDDRLHLSIWDSWRNRL